MNPVRMKLFFTLIALLAAAVPAWAHHAFAAEFDANKPVKLQGTVTKLEWINPHAWIHLEVKQPDGKVEEWMIEGGTPNTLLRRGISRDSIKIGTVVMVDGIHFRDRVILVALGIDAKGNKYVLGLREGSTEATRVV